MPIDTHTRTSAKVQPKPIPGFFTEGSLKISSNTGGPPGTRYSTLVRTLPVKTLWGTNRWSITQKSLYLFTLLALPHRSLLCLVQSRLKINIYKSFSLILVASTLSLLTIVSLFLVEELSTLALLAPLNLRTKKNNKPKYLSGKYTQRYFD